MSFFKKNKVMLVVAALAMILCFGGGIKYQQYTAPTLAGVDGIIPLNSQNQEIVVDIRGAVENPGVYTLPAQSRVNDVLERAVLLPGADIDNLNRAAFLEDGQFLKIADKADTAVLDDPNPADGEDALGGDGTSDNSSSNGNSSGSTSVNGTSSNDGNSSSGLDGSKININTAGSSLLQSLPGIGEAKAGAIISYRNENGSFKTISDLKKVSGIGDATYKKLEGLICVD